MTCLAELEQPKRKDARSNFLIPASQLRKLSQIWAVVQTLNTPARIALAILAHDSTKGSRLVPPTARTQREFGCFLRDMVAAGHLDQAVANTISAYGDNGVMPSTYGRRPDWLHDDAA